MIPATRSKGVDVPLVFNEMGVMADPSVYSNDYYPAAQQPENSLTVNQKMQDELSFAEGYSQNTKDMGVGVCSFYWMQTGVWQGWESQWLAHGHLALSHLNPVKREKFS